MQVHDFKWTSASGLHDYIHTWFSAQLLANSNDSGQLRYNRMELGNRCWLYSCADPRDKSSCLTEYDICPFHCLVITKTRAAQSCVRSAQAKGLQYIGGSQLVWFCTSISWILHRGDHGTVVNRNSHIRICLMVPQNELKSVSKE